LEPGDHVCALYLGSKERDEVLLPYLREGLQAGDKCICVLDSTDPLDVLAGTGDEIDAVASVISEQLQLCKSTDAYLRSSWFSTDDMLAFWEDSVGTAVSYGRFRFARVAGELPWVLRNRPERDEFFRYESQLNRFVPRYPQAVLCLYDLARFGGGMLVDLLKTRLKLLLGGMVLDNPHFVPPDEFLAARQ
jgi:hypothetical protein